MPVFLERGARLALVLHGVLGFAAVAAATHLAVDGVQLWRGRPGGQKRAHRFGGIVPVLVLAAFAAGLLVYPAYRVRVRLDWLDAHAPLAATLFELKEHLAALSLPCIGAAAVLARSPSAKDVRWMAGPLSLAGAALVWTAALLGLYVSAVRAVGPLP